MTDNREMILIPKGGRPPKRIPSDLLELAPTMSRAELAVHYDVSVSTINRWLRKEREACAKPENSEVSN